jgi:hypothetical protein
MVAKAIKRANPPLKISNATRPEYRGITAKFCAEGRDFELTRRIKISSKILSTNEQKTTRHFPGLNIIATSVQQSERLGKKNWMRVCLGDRMEILCSRGGNDFDVYSYGQRARGVVRLYSVEMQNEPDYSQDGKPIVENTSWGCFESGASTAS